MLGRILTAEEAKRIGLVTEVINGWTSSLLTAMIIDFMIIVIMDMKIEECN